MPARPDTRRLLRLLAIWFVMAVAMVFLAREIPHLMGHHPSPDELAAMTAEARAEAEAHAKHVGLWQAVVIYLAIFAAVGTVLAAIVSFLNLAIYDRQAEGAAGAHH